MCLSLQNIEKAEQISAEINERFDTNVKALPGGTNDERVASILGASIVMATGASGVVLLNKKIGLKASPSRLFAMQMRCLL